ncbi:porin family protein [Pontibacter mangrovi]|uniref:PorT family protein n=1 Tax=Pontibacter mangrovi TaxID=2589816 RepID=A0A501WFQ4_9BACT|nr:porin family protein [Pontibacter mangrovi]TPE44356.1 PorT family protein [Pontibacter mangrovi]
MKTSTLLLFILSLCCSFSAAAQDEPKLTIGAKAGINFYSLSSDALIVDDDTGLSYEFGVYGRIGERLFVQPELNFVSHKTHLITRIQTRAGERDALTVRYLRIPVMLGYRTDYDGKIASRIRFMAGPSISYAVGVADNNLGIKRNDIHNAQFALNGGVGFEVWLLHLDLLYHHYFTALLNDGRAEGKGRAFSISAGVGF